MGEVNWVVVYSGIKKIYSLNGNTVVLDVLDLIIDKSRCLTNYSRSLFSADLLSADLHSAAFCKILI